MDDRRIRIYLAGPLFNVAERLHNLYLERELRTAFGYDVILPQREGKKFFKDGKFDLHAMVESCVASSCDERNIVVACIDGADADSGTAVEVGMALRANGRVVLYRTDFRTDIDREIGVNAMLLAKGARMVYHPAYFIHLDDVSVFYRLLAGKIHTAIKGVMGEP